MPHAPQPSSGNASEDLAPLRLLTLGWMHQPGQPTASCTAPAAGPALVSRSLSGAWLKPRVTLPVAGQPGWQLGKYLIEAIYRPNLAV